MRLLAFVKNFRGRIFFKIKEKIPPEVRLLRKHKNFNVGSFFFI